MLNKKVGVIAFIIFLLIDSFMNRKKIKRIMEEKSGEWERAESNNELKKILAIWMQIRNERKFLSAYFGQKKFNRIAIYGMAELGMLLYQELNKTEIEVVYGVDRKGDILHFNIPVIKPDEVTANIDAIVVTPVYYFEEIYDMLNEKFGGSIPIIGLDEIIYSLEKMK